MVNEGSNNTGDSALFNSVSDGLKHPQQAHHRQKSAANTARSFG